METYNLKLNKKLLIKQIIKTIRNHKTIKPSLIVLSNKIHFFKYGKIYFFDSITINKHLDKIETVCFYKYLNDNHLSRVLFLNFSNLNLFFKKLTLLQLQSFLIDLKLYERKYTKY